jgi:hypothetical protein
MVREIVVWVFTWVKIRSTSETTKTNAKKIFNKNSRKIIWDVFWLSCAIWGFTRNMRDTSPLTRWGVIVSVLWTFDVFIWSLALCWDAATMFIRRRSATQV